MHLQPQTKDSSSTAILVTSAACLALVPGSVCMAGVCWQSSCKQTLAKMEHMQAHTDSGAPIFATVLQAQPKQKLRANRPNDMTCPLCMFVAGKVSSSRMQAPACVHLSLKRGSRATLTPQPVDTSTQLDMPRACCQV